MGGLRLLLALLPLPCGGWEVPANGSMLGRPTFAGGGRCVVVPIRAADSLVALDTASGAVRWRFFTGGPVRFAPVATEGRVYFGSDDGHLYCVGATDGKLRWKVYGMPGGRTDRNLLGNRRLIPMCRCAVERCSMPA